MSAQLPLKKVSKECEITVEQKNDFLHMPL